MPVGGQQQALVHIFIFDPFHSHLQLFAGWYYILYLCHLNYLEALVVCRQKHDQMVYEASSGFVFFCWIYFFRVFFKQLPPPGDCIEHSCFSCPSCSQSNDQSLSSQVLKVGGTSLLCHFLWRLWSIAGECKLWLLLYQYESLAKIFW